MNEQKLINILLDKSAKISDRDDAAMDLSAFDSDIVLEALLIVGMDDNVDPVILASVGESLADIWSRNNNFNLDRFNALSKITKFAITENMNMNF